MRRATTIAAAVAAVAVSACGSSSSSSNSNAGSPSAAIKTYLTALANGDGARACGVLTTSMQNRALNLARSQGIKASSCSSLFSQVKGQTTAAQRRTLLNAKIASVKVNGNTATVTLKGGTQAATLTKTGGKWLISGGITSG
jgi:hypothetical protein